MTDPRQQYDRAHIARSFDEDGEQEWERMVSGPVNEVSLHVHTHYLKQHVPAGAKVLEAGAQPGAQDMGTHILAAAQKPV